MLISSLINQEFELDNNIMKKIKNITLTSTEENFKLSIRQLKAIKGGVLATGPYKAARDKD